MSDIGAIPFKAKARALTGVLNPTGAMVAMEETPITSAHDGMTVVDGVDDDDGTADADDRADDDRADDAGGAADADAEDDGGEGLVFSRFWRWRETVE